MVIKNPTLEEETSREFIESIQGLEAKRKEFYIKEKIPFMNNFHMYFEKGFYEMYESGEMLDSKYSECSKLKSKYTIREFIDFVIETGKKLGVVVEDDFQGKEYQEIDRMIFPVYKDLREQGFTREDLIR